MYNSRKPYNDYINNSIRKTWNSRYVKINNEGIIIKKIFTSFGELDHTDGIGTKGILHWKQRNFHAAVLDALAMNINDLSMARAIPYKLQNHITIPEENHEAIQMIVDFLSEECFKRNIAITGGETSIHNNTDSLEISITMSGFIRKSYLPYRKNQIKEKDIILGLPSNGMHSNGFTFVRNAIKNYEDYKEVSAPTAIYQIPHRIVNGMMHITGGAYTKIRKILPNNLDAIIDQLPEPTPLFAKLCENYNDETMYSAFNCGIGFVLTTPERFADIVCQELGAKIIGKIVSGNSKIKIKSQFTDNWIVFS